VLLDAKRVTFATQLLRAITASEDAQLLANHASIRRTQLCDHSVDELTLDKVERISI
jgi:hypothetical protein